MGKGHKAGSSKHVDQLVAQGYGKTKAAQALKDAGNNYQVALRVLERQKEQLAAKSAKPVVTQSTPVGLVAPSRVNAPRDGVTEAAATEKVIALHPCIVQYKKCQFGDYCRLRNLPGDVCINYYNGNCVYGDLCRRRHTVDGVDLREGQHTEISDVFTRDDGTKYRIVSTGHGRNAVQVAQLVQAEEGCSGPDTDVLLGKVAYVPDAADFNLIRGAEPTHTDPFLHCELRSNAAQGNAPQPFREKLMNGAPAAPPTPLAIRVGLSNGPTTSSPSTVPSRVVVNGRTKHPCIAQCGSCKYGTFCEHADRDADVCVHFLNGRCKYSDADCHYRHETQEDYAAKILAGMQERPSTSPSTGAAAGAASISTKKVKDRLQLAHPSNPPHSPTSPPPAGHSTSSPAHHALVANPASDYVDDSQEGGSGWQTVTREQGRGETTPGRPSAVTADQFFPPMNPVGGGGPAGGKDEWTVRALDPEPESPAVLDSEMDTFLGLLEAFPDEEPALILQALRSAGGDPAAVADLVVRVEETAVADIDSALAAALAEEASAESEADRRSRELVAKSEALLTLCSLFPALEVNSIEAVYHNHNDNFEDTYESLLCSQENITRRDYGNVWRGNVNPAEQLRLEKLTAMFPDIHPDIVRSTFGASEKDTKRTIAAFNNLSLELLSLKTREEMGAAAARWRPHAPTSSTGNAARALPRSLPDTGYSSPSSADIATTEAEVQRLYKAAEAELREHGDWRRVRMRAYGMNACRLRVLSQASAAYLRGDGAIAKALSREGYELGCEYERLNRLAMLALEMERLKSDPASSLDLHGFHAVEAVEVLTRRIELCQRKHIRSLIIVVGEGHHSRRGETSLARAVTSYLEEDSYMRDAVRLVSVKPGHLVARIVQV